MATRFGAVSPAHTYATKVRWLVGCLFAVIVILAIAIVMIAQSASSSVDDGPQVTVNQPKQPTQVATVDVLVAVSRIEEGKLIEPHMFRPVPMDRDKVPLSAVSAREADKVVNKFAKRLIVAETPLALDDVTDSPPLSSFRIPAGYRAATITVDARSGVEGFARPNTRVDVLWSYSQDGRKKVATIARFVKVLSVAGNTEDRAERASLGAKSTTVTLLVTEKDAKKVELARSLGTLSLSLVGDEETASRANEPDTVTIQDLIGRPAAVEPQDSATEGVMYSADPRTGRQIRYVLRNGRWARDRSYGGGN